MQNAVAVFLITLSFITPAPADTPKLKRDDFAPLTGAQWKGTLTYLDYRSNKKTSIPSNLTVTRSVEDKRSWTFDYQYPKEPQADGKKTLTISADGTNVNDEKVVERTLLADKTLRIVTEKQGTDDDKPALFRYTYLLSASKFSIRKEVRPDGAGEFFERNEYSWTR